MSGRCCRSWMPAPEARRLPGRVTCTCYDGLSVRIPLDSPFGVMRATGRGWLLVSMTMTPRTRILSGAMVVAPVLLLLSTVANMTNGEGMNNGEAGGVLQVWGMAAYALVAVGLTRLLEERSPRAAAW